MKYIRKSKVKRLQIKHHFDDSWKLSDFVQEAFRPVHTADMPCGGYSFRFNNEGRVCGMANAPFYNSVRRAAFPVLFVPQEERQVRMGYIERSINKS